MGRFADDLGRCLRFATARAASLRPQPLRVFAEWHRYRRARVKPQRRPCAECPWRRDVAPGQFSPERFIALANTTYDMSMVQFACHKAPGGGEFACAGFLERGAVHNLAVRLAYGGGRYERCDRSGGLELVDDYREMAIRNGVPRSHPALKACR